MTIILSEYIKEIKKEIESVPGVSKVYNFGGSVTKEDVKKTLHQRNKVNVFLTLPGCEFFNGTQKNTIGSNARFGVIVSGLVDPGEMGFSSNVMNLCQKIMGHIQNLRINNGAGQLKLPDFKYMKEQANAISSDSKQTAWVLVWDQSLSLDTK